MSTMCRCTCSTVPRPNVAPNHASLDDSLSEGSVSSSYPRRDPRLFSAAEGCNIKALQLNPTPNICHFPLTPKIKSHGTLQFYPMRKNTHSVVGFDIIKLHLVQLVHEILLLVLLNLFRHPSGRLTEHPVQAACHHFLSLFLSLCVGLRLSLLGGVNIRHAVIRSAGLPRLCGLDSKRMWHFSDSRESSQWEARPPLLWPTNTVHSRTH